MALRDLLQSVDFLSEGASGLRQKVGQMEQEKSIRDLAQQVPEAAESGDFSGIASGMLASTGDATLVRDLMQQQYKSKQAQMAQSMEGRLSPELIAGQLGIPVTDPRVAEIANIPSIKDQQAAVRSTEQGLSRRTREGRFAKDDEEQARARFADKVDQKVKPYRTALEDITRLQNMDPQDRTQFAVLMTNVIKSIGKEAGALAKEDIDRPYLQDIRNQMTSLQQYWMSDSNKVPFNPAQVRSTLGLLSKFEDYNRKKLKTRAAQAIQEQANVGGDRLFGKADKAFVVQDAMDRYGVVGKRDKNGRFKVDTEITEKPKTDSDLKNAEPAVIDQLKTIKDPKTRGFYEEGARYFANKKDTTSADYKEFLRRLSEVTAK